MDTNTHIFTSTTINRASSTRGQPRRRPNRQKMASIGVAAMRLMTDTEDTDAGDTDTAWHVALSSAASSLIVPNTPKNNTVAATVTVITSGVQATQHKAYIAAPITAPGLPSLFKEKEDQEPHHHNHQLQPQITKTNSLVRLGQRWRQHLQRQFSSSPMVMDDEEKDSLSITSGNTDITAGTTSLMVDDETSSPRGGVTSSRHRDHPPLVSSLKPRPLSFHRRSSSRTRIPAATRTIRGGRSNTSRHGATTTTVHEAVSVALPFTAKPTRKVSAGQSLYEMDDEDNDWGSFVPFQ